MKNLLVLPLGLAASLGLSACASDEKKDVAGPSQPKAASADKSRCESNGKKVVELDVNHDGKPDVWKFYGNAIDNGAKVEVLTCKEVDLNFDGRKDIWVYYDNSGNVTLEEFDLDFDGRIDLWTYRQQGKIIRQELDTNYDGRPDIWRYFEGEKLVRIERSSKRNDKIDVWEYYEGGKLDRIGYDTTGSGKIDKWDRAPEEQSAEAQAVPNPSAAQAPAAAPARQSMPSVTPESGGASAPAPKK